VTRPTLTLPKGIDLWDHIPDGEVVAAGWGPDDDLALVVTEPAEATVARGGSSGAGADHRYRATLLRVSPDGQDARAARVDLDLVASRVQPLDDGGYLVASSRCARYTDGTHELNGAVLAADGRELRRVLLGDGIGELQVDRNGGIWVGYFDEGVFGNLGWDKPVGAPGLIRFAQTGDALWKYPQGFEHPPQGDVMRNQVGLSVPPPIDDCYAMNVAYDAVWICPYSDFPLVRIGFDGATRSWPPIGVDGPGAFAVADGRVLMFGGYRSNGDLRRVVVGDVADDVVRPVQEFDLVGPDGTPLDANPRVEGRGPTLHVLAGTTWSRLDVRDFA